MGQGARKLGARKLGSRADVLRLYSTALWESDS